MSARQCGVCGKDPAAGFASYWSQGTGEVWFCHGDDDASPTCYEQAHRQPWTNPHTPAADPDTTPDEREGER